MISVVIISKDEAAWMTRCCCDRQARAREPFEIVVVDASGGRLDYIRRRHQPAVRWINSSGRPESPSPSRTSATPGCGGARRDHRLHGRGLPAGAGMAGTARRPTRQGEEVAAGWPSRPGRPGCTLAGGRQRASRYLKECPTINLAFHREVFDAVGGFDETFAYGSDVDFRWRLIAAGYRIRCVPDARRPHDWGGRAARRRSYLYGKARARLYRKHRRRLRTSSVTTPWWSSTRSSCSGFR